MKNKFGFVALAGIALCIFLMMGATKETDAAFQGRVQKFLTDYNNTYRQLNIVGNETQWRLLTHIVKGDTASENAAQRASSALAEFQGSAEVIKSTQEFLA